MSDSGYLDPVSAYSVSAGLGAVRPWEPGLGAPGTLVSGVSLSDDVKVHVTDVSTAATQFPFFAQFSANIAAGSEVQGFSVRYERRGNAAVTAAGASERWLRLVSGAGTGVQYVSTTVNANTGAWTTTDTYVTAGGSADMWGMTTADASSGRINSTRFGVAIRAAYAGGTVTSAAMSIDHVQLQIHYTPPTTNAEIFSSEFDREVFSASIVPNVIGQSAEYEWAVQSVQPSLNLNPQTVEMGYELRPVDISPVSAHAAEFDSSFGSLAVSLNLNPVGAEFGYEAAQIDLEQGSSTVNADVKTAEFDYEAASLGLVLNVAAQSAETEFEAGSVVLASLSNIGVQSAETGFEAGVISLVQNLIPNSQEFDTEVSNAGLTQLHALGVESSEYGSEVGSVGNSLILNPLSAEFEAEFSSLGLVQNVAVGGFEGDFEAGSVLIAQVALSVDDLEAGFEVGAAQLVKNLGVEGSEHGFESGSASIGSELTVVNAELDYETEGPAFGYLLSPVASDRGWEVSNPSLSLDYFLGVSSMEFDRDWGGNVTPIRNRMDWLREIQGKVHRERELRRRKWA